jgi:transcriptional regulator with XRE-family HTH domain
MEDVKNIRQKLGMNQELFANVLGISRVQLAQIEGSRRKLSTNSLIKLGDLEIAQRLRPEFQPDEDNLHVLVAKRDAYLTELTRRLENQEKQFDKLQAQLARNEQKFARACEALRMITEEQKLFEGVSKYQQNLQTQYDSYMKVYLTTHPNSCLDLKLKIKEVEAGIIILKEEMGSFNQNESL